MAVAAAATAALLWWPKTNRPAGRVDEAPTAAAAVGPATVRIDPDSAFARRLQIVELLPETISAPALSVTGRVLATRTGDDGPRFASADLAALFADWERAGIELEFAGEQRRMVGELVAARDSARMQVVKRLELLVESGSESERDLTQARHELAEQRLEGSRQEHEAENALALARRNVRFLARRLQLLGLDPDLLQSLRGDRSFAVVVAEVPEARMALVHAGMTGEARFRALGGDWRSATLTSIAPGIAEDRRVLPVQLTVDDPEHRIRPGMFADVRLGTEPRPALLLPAPALLRAGQADYAFVAVGNDRWRVTAVGLGAVLGDRFEVLSGLSAGDRVIGAGAILLRPLLAPSLDSTVKGGG